MGLSECSVEALLAVSDLERARRFYEEQLGLVPGEEEEQGVRYPCAQGTRIFVYLSPENAGRSPATVAGWFVDDLDQTMDELASRGVVFEHYDMPGIETDERGVFDAGRFRAAWIFTSRPERPAGGPGSRGSPRRTPPRPRARSCRPWVDP
jgi:catechol 2,3-dioxygenase-like lactoylglutathione lyase family enzyme